MSFFKKMLSRIIVFFHGGDDIPSVGVFPKIDPEKIKQQLQIIERAKEHGAKGIPLESATQLSDVEHSILGHLGNIRESLMTWATTSLRVTQDRLNSIDITKVINRSTQLGNEYERDIDQMISGQQGQIAELRSIAAIKTEALENFQSINKINHVANMPTVSMSIFYIAVIFAFVAIEGIINAWFFAEGLTSGLIGGFLFAGILSAANVVICFLIGRVIPYKNHIKISLRVCGFIAILVIAFWALIMGLVTAHIRDALPLVTDESQSEWVIAKETFIAAPFILHDISSYLLLGLTIIFGVFGAWKGCTWSDYYPGYTKIYFAYENSQREYNQVLGELRNDIEKHKSSILEQLDRNVNEANDDVSNFKRNMKTKLITKKRLDEGMIYADESLKSLIQKYRIENQLARENPKSVPDYFNDPIAFPSIPYPHFGTDHDEEKLAEQERLMTDMISNIEGIREGIQKSFNQKYDQFLPLQQIV